MVRRDDEVYNEVLRIEIAYKSPDLFESLGNNFDDVAEYTQQDNCLIITMWNRDEIVIPMREILYFVIS